MQCNIFGKHAPTKVNNKALEQGNATMEIAQLQQAGNNLTVS